MAKGLSVSITGWLQNDVPELARQSLVKLVGDQKARVHSEQAARSGINVSPDLENQIVDGQRSASESAIKADSKVILDWNYMAEAVIKTMTALQTAGPERSGAWKKSLVLLIDGTEQPIDTSIPADAKQATIVVTVPYARKLEVGRTESGRAFSVQVPQHFVESTMMKLRSQLSDLAKFSFAYVDLAGAHQLTERGQHRRSFRHGHAELGAKRRGETTVSYPSIQIDEIKAI